MPVHLRDSHSPADFFVMRTPLLPVTELFNLNQGLSNGVNFFNEIERLFNTLLLKEAIYLASPILYYEFEKLQITDKKDQKDRERIALSLYQYFIRLTSRCTPFGLFAGYNIGSIDSNAELEILSSQFARKHVRLDMDFLCNLTAAILTKYPKDIFSYHINSSLYPVSNKLRYIETKYANGVRSYDIAAIDSNILLQYLLNFAKSTRSYSELLKFILGEFEASEAEARHLLNKMIDNQVLINSIEANVTGPEYQDTLLAALKKIPAVREEYQLLQQAAQSVGVLGETGQNNVPDYQLIKSGLKRVLPGLNEAKLFQTDLIKQAADCTISFRTANRVREACWALALLNPPVVENTYFDRFKKQFTERYETANVKLVDALDAENGINYHEGVNASANQTDTRIIGYKLSKYYDCIRRQSSEVIIEDRDLESFQRQVIFPDSFGSLICVYNNAENPAEPIIELKNVHGPSAANLMGRFCQSSDELKDKVCDLLSVEEKQNDQVVFAEITHIPQSRSGNVICRPYLRKKEIVFMANSNLPDECKIPLNDLYLKMKNGKLVMFSKSMKKEVTPRLSCAHNFSHTGNLQLYHFLCDLQSQEYNYAQNWSWDVLAGQDFLPRVTYKGVILNSACWNLSNSSMSFFKTKQPRDLANAFSDFKIKRKLPDHVYFSEGDNELLLNLSDRNCVMLLQKEWIKGKSFKFREVIYNESNLIVRDEQGAFYTNELVIPFSASKQSILPPRKSKNEFHITQNVKRNFHVGSEWVYFNIFTGNSTADKILMQVVESLAGRLLKSGKISEWFFIRYTNPKFHLRLRLHLIATKDFGWVVSLIQKNLKSYIRSGEVSDVSLNTYKREIERYGILNIVDCEQFFYINSVCVLQLIKLNALYKITLDEQLMIATLGFEYILSALGLSTEERFSLCNDSQASFANEFGLNKSPVLKERLRKEYRENRTVMLYYLTGNLEELPVFYNDVKRIFESQRQTSEVIMTRLRKTAKKGQPTIRELASSIVHMFANRYFQSNNRFHEFVIYDRLTLYYKTKLMSNK